MKKSSILKNLSIVIVVLLLATDIYSYYFDHLQRINPKLDYYLGIFSGGLHNLSLCLILLFVSNSFKSIKKYNLFNYISVLTAALLLISRVFIYIGALSIQSISEVYIAHELLETIVTCLVIISLLLFNQDKKTSDDQ